jgi:hypothetical protein
MRGTSAHARARDAMDRSLPALGIGRRPSRRLGRTSGAMARGRLGRGRTRRRPPAVPTAGRARPRTRVDKQTRGRGRRAARQRVPGRRLRGARVAGPESCAAGRHTDGVPAPRRARASAVPSGARLTRCFATCCTVAEAWGCLAAIAMAAAACSPPSAASAGRAAPAWAGPRTLTCRGNAMRRQSSHRERSWGPQRPQRSILGARSRAATERMHAVFASNETGEPGAGARGGGGRLFTQTPPLRWHPRPAS